MENPKIIWMSNSPLAPTGYGVVTKNITFRLKKLYNYDVRVAAYWGQEGSTINVDGILIYPKMFTQFGDDMINLIVKNINPDIFVSLFDVWVGVNWLPKVHKNWIAYCPVDHDPIPKAVYLALKEASCPLAMSKFGLAKMKERNLDAEYIPHGTETDIFKPLNNKENIRHEWFKNVKQFSVKDNFLIGINAANKGNRKSFPRMIAAYKLFLDNNPDAKKDSKLYLNTWMRFPEGYDLHELLKQFDVMENTIVVNEWRRYLGMSSEQLNEWYNMIDLFLNCAMGEGFGVPIIEAQSCGIPVIATEFSSMIELVKDHGWLIPITDMYMTPLLSYQGLASVPKIADAIEEAYNKDDKRKKYGQMSREFAVKNYDYDRTILPMWRKLIEKIMEEDKQKDFMKPNVLLRKKKKKEPKKVNKKNA